MRSRKFNPKNFFFSVLHLAAATNRDGYFTALHRTWQKSGLSLTDTPTKSSLSEYREKVSSNFFKDIFHEDLRANASGRKMFRGHFIYAVDGDHFDLPASEDIIRLGYRGYSVLKNEETHYPKMYTVQAIDLVNNIITKFSYEKYISEVQQARKLVSQFEANSITIYDRLHQTYETALEHVKAKNHFFMRVKSENPMLAVQIRRFCQSNRKTQWIDLRPPGQLKDLTLPTIRVRLFRVKNKRSSKAIVFMTNAHENLIRDKEMGEFYQKRWGIESSFRNLTDTFKLCQWHSQKLDGILQEIYALLWLVNNAARIAITQQTAHYWLDRDYKKANLKVIMTLLMDQIDLLLKQKYRKLNYILNCVAKRTVEQRTRLSRSYPRQVKCFGKKYLNASRIPRRTP